MPILHQDVGRKESWRTVLTYLRNLENTARSRRGNPRVLADARETLRTAPLGALLADPAFAAESVYLTELQARIAAGDFGPPPTARAAL